MRGKLDMPNTIRNRIQRKQKLACEFDELSENNLFNQILKTAVRCLLMDDGVDSERKIALKKALVFFDGIQLLKPSEIAWSRLHSNHVYQIFMYVKNQDKDNTGNVAGILLYAKTDEDFKPDVMFHLGGNQIGAKTLDLNKEFSFIAAQLDKIAEDYFGVPAKQIRNMPITATINEL